MSSVELDLLPGEQVVIIESVPWQRPERRVQVDELLARMANVEVVEDIGTNGLAVASRTVEQRHGEGRCEAEFARDALVMATFGHDRFPALTEVTVRRLAEVQGLEDRPGSDTEEAGRIPHEIREPNDPIRQLMTERFGWEWPYFGSVDATPLFVSAAVRAEMERPGFLAETVVQGDGRERPLALVVSESVRWIIRKLDESPDVLIESEPASNACWQVWADSPDAYHHNDGRLARGRVAAIEVQAFTYDALTNVVRLLESAGGIAEMMNAKHRLHPSALRERAEQLRQNVLSHFWIETTSRDGFFAIGVERHAGVSTPLAIRSVNMGLLLDTGLLEGAGMWPYVRGIVTELMSPDGFMLTPTGIRSLGSDSPRFRPLAYHNGSIWPWTNYRIAAGLTRHGMHELAGRLRARIDAACLELGCYPEMYQGVNGDHPVMNEAIASIMSQDGNGGVFEHPVMMVAQLYQGWTAFGYDWSRRVRHEVGDMQISPLTVARRELERQLIDES